MQNKIIGLNVLLLLLVALFIVAFFYFSKPSAALA